MTASDRPATAFRIPHIDCRLLALAGVMSLVVFGYELFSFTLSIDEEVRTYDTAIAAAWLAQGRWGMAVLATVLPRLEAIPFLATLLFCAGLSIAATLAAPLVAGDFAERAFFVVLLVVFPVWPHVVEFNTLSFGIGIGLCAAILAVRLALRDGHRSIAYGAALFAFAAAVYQTLPLVYLVVGLLWLASGFPADPDRQSRRLVWTGAVRLALVLVSGLALYGVVTGILRQIVPSDTYIDVYVNWRGFITDFGPAARNTRTAVVRVLGGTDPMYLRAGLPFQLLAFAGLLALFAARAPRDMQPGVHRAVPALLHLAAAGVALAPIVVATGYAPVRTLTSLPFVFAAIGARSLRLHRITWPQWSILGFAALTGTWIAVTLFYSDAIARQRDEITATLLASRINEVARPFLPGRIPLLVVGELRSIEDPALRRVEAFGASFFEQDGGNSWRVAYYLRLKGIPDLDAQPIAKLVPIAAEIDAMPNWPLAGSVRLVNGTLVVKFGPPGAGQRRAIDAERARVAVPAPDPARSPPDTGVSAVQ